MEGWVSQTHQVENKDNTILDVFLVSENQIEHFRRSYKVLNLQMLCIAKLKALLIKSLSNPSIFFRKYQLHENTIALEHSRSENFWEIPRKTSVTELTQYSL